MTDIGTELATIAENTGQESPMTVRSPDATKSHAKHPVGAVQEAKAPEGEKATPEFQARVQAALRTRRTFDPAPSPAILHDLQTNPKWKWIAFPDGAGPTTSSAVIDKSRTQANATEFYWVITGGVVGIAYRGPYALAPKA